MDPWGMSLGEGRPMEILLQLLQSQWTGRPHYAMDSGATSQIALEPTAVEVNIPVRDKGKRKIVDHMVEEKSCKFRADPLVEKETMAIEVKMQ